MQTACHMEVTHTHTHMCVPCGKCCKFAEFKFWQCSELSKFTTYYFTKHIIFEGSINLFLLVSNVTSSWLFHGHPSKIKHEEMVVLTLPHYPLKPSTYSILFIFSPCKNHPLQKTHTLSNPSLFLCFQSSSISQCVIS
jgi:hypothetical protein